MSTSRDQRISFRQAKVKLRLNALQQLEGLQLPQENEYPFLQDFVGEHNLLCLCSSLGSDLVHDRRIIILKTLALVEKLLLAESKDAVLRSTDLPQSLAASVCQSVDDVITQRSAQDIGILTASKQQILAKSQVATLEEEQTQEEILMDQANMLKFVAARVVEENKSWADLKGLSEAMKLRDAITERLESSSEAVSSCQRVAEKVWECLEAKELAYVKTLQDSATHLDTLLKMLTEQCVAFEALVVQQAQGALSTFEGELADHIAQRRADMLTSIEAQQQTEDLILLNHATAVKDYSMQFEDTRTLNVSHLQDLVQRMGEEYRRMQLRLEKLKSSQKLMADKLLYDERILKERSLDSEVMLLEQKRRLDRQTKQLAALQHINAAAGIANAAEAARLAKDINKLNSDISRQSERQERFGIRSEQTIEEVQNLKVKERGVLRAINKEQLHNVIPGLVEGTGDVSEVVDPLFQKELLHLLERSFEEYLQLLLSRTRQIREVQKLRDSKMYKQRSLKAMTI